MGYNQDKLDQLLSRLQTLVNQQENFSKEINTLREEVNQLKGQKSHQPLQEKQKIDEGTPPDPEQQKASEIHASTLHSEQKTTIKPKAKDPSTLGQRKMNTNLEKFIWREPDQ